MIHTCNPSTDMGSGDKDKRIATRSRPGCCKRKGGKRGKKKEREREIGGVLLGLRPNTPVSAQGGRVAFGHLSFF